MKLYVVLLVVLACPLLASAGEKGELVSLLADYAALKQRVKEMQSARQDGYSSDSKEVIALMQEIQAANKEVYTYQAQLKSGSDVKAYAVPWALGYAYTAMLAWLITELDRNTAKTDLAAKLSDKYLDIWQTADPYIPVYSAPSP